MKKASESYTQPQSLILLGAPGAGKTTLLTQFPKPFILDCDQNLGGPIKWLRENNRPLDFYYDSPFTDDGVPVERPKLFQRCATLLADAAASDDVSTIIVDSLTSFSDIVLTETKRQQGRRLGNFDFKTASSKTSDEQMQIQDWGVFFGLMKEIVFRLKATGKTVIFTGHLKTKEDDLNKMLRQYIAIPGQMAEVISSFFSEVWLLESSMKFANGKKSEVREVTTFPQSPTFTTLGLKSSAGVTSGTKVDADDLLKKLFS